MLSRCKKALANFLIKLDTMGKYSAERFSEVGSPLNCMPHLMSGQATTHKPASARSQRGLHSYFGLTACLGLVVGLRRIQTGKCTNKLQTLFARRDLQRSNMLHRPQKIGLSYIPINALRAILVYDMLNISAIIPFVASECLRQVYIMVLRRELGIQITIHRSLRSAAISDRK